MGIVFENTAVKHKEISRRVALGLVKQVVRRVENSGKS
jgi:hypothetical protein